MTVQRTMLDYDLAPKLRDAMLERYGETATNVETCIAPNTYAGFSAIYVYKDFDRTFTAEAAHCVRRVFESVLRTCKGPDGAPLALFGRLSRLDGTNVQLERELDRTIATVTVSLPMVCEIVDAWHCAPVHAFNALLTHEAMHLVLGHFSNASRRKFAENATRANVAADYEVNLKLEFPGAPALLPSDVGYAPKLTMDAYWRMLTHDADEAADAEVELDTSTMNERLSSVEDASDDVIASDSDASGETQMKQFDEMSLDAFDDTSVEVAVNDAVAALVANELARHASNDASERDVKRLLARCSHDLRELAEAVRRDEASPQLTRSSWTSDWTKLPRRERDGVLAPGRRRTAGGAKLRYDDCACVFIDRSPSTTYADLDRQLEAAAAAMHQTDRVKVAYYCGRLMATVNPHETFYAPPTTGYTDFCNAFAEYRTLTGESPKRVYVLTDGEDSGLVRLLDDPSTVGIDELHAYIVSPNGSLRDLKDAMLRDV